MEDLVPLVHTELRRLARGYLRCECSGHRCWQTAALINEAYLRLMDLKIDCQNRTHFFQHCGASRAPHSRKPRAQVVAKRGGEQERVSLTNVAEMPDARDARISNATK